MTDHSQHGPAHEGHDAHAAQATHIVPVPVYLAVFGALMLGTLLTVMAARVDFGPLNTVIALAIAITKALLVILFFMHVKYSSGLTKLFLGVAFLLLAVMLLVTISDYYSPPVTTGPAPPALKRQ